VSALLIGFVQVSASSIDRNADHHMYYELPSNEGARSLVSVNASVKKFLEEPAKDPIRQFMVKAIDTAVRYALQIVQKCLKQNSPFFVRTICRDLLAVLCLPKVACCRTTVESSSAGDVERCERQKSLDFGEEDCTRNSGFHGSCNFMPVR